MYKNKPGFRVLALLALMLFALPMASQAANANMSDSDIKDRVEHVLNPYNDVNVNVDNGRVVLDGTVTTNAQRAEAIAHVRNVTGVRSVKDEIRVAGMNDSQSVGEYLDDAGITARVKAEFLTQSGLDSGNISVETNNGVVMLTGNVPNNNQISMAEQVVARINGVQRVDNRLAVRR